MTDVIDFGAVTRPRFCVACGGELEPGGERFVCRACGRPTYLNPRACSSGVVVRDGAVLLVRRNRPPFLDWWDVPGGFMDIGEDPGEAARRELREETGLEVEVGALIGIYPDVYEFRGEVLATLNVFYECSVIGGVEQAGDDAGDTAWFPADALPENVAFACCRRALADWRKRRFS